MNYRKAPYKVPPGVCLGPATEVLEPIQAGILVVDENFRILSANRVARDLLDMDLYPLTPGESCHGRLQKSEDPCPDCPVLKGGEARFFQKARSLKHASGRSCYLKEYMASWGRHIIITLQDVTREIQALRKTEFARKELKAKNVLTERHRRVSAVEKTNLNHLLDYLPDALVQVDETFHILRKNHAVLESMPQGQADTCFGLFGLAAPCDSCPAKGGFTGLRNVKTNQPVGDQYFTEIVTEATESGGGVLLFRNTTRQIQLIEKIREQQETITQKNDILSGLVRLGTIMQQETDPKVVVNLFLDMFIPVCHVEAVGVIISDIRPGSLWFTAQRGLKDGQMMRFIRSSFSMRGSEFDTATRVRKDLDRRGITALQITGGDGRSVGVTFLVNLIENKDDNLIPLFFEPLGAYLRNRILTRQLEERANTDPLTGLYNRGYLETVLGQEEKKYAEFDLPYAVVVADVNGLKPVNDEYGHGAGDALIMTVARHLKSATRETDCLARTGGDEFVILLGNTTDAGAQQLIERLLMDVFSDASFEARETERLPVSVSFGACGVDTVAPAQMLLEADRRMYEAKEAYYSRHSRYR